MCAIRPPENPTSGVSRNPLLPPNRAVVATPLWEAKRLPSSALALAHTLREFGQVLAQPTLKRHEIAIDTRYTHPTETARPRAHGIRAMGLCRISVRDSVVQSKPPSSRCSKMVRAAASAKFPYASSTLSTMYCEKCATQLPDHAAFCHTCGKPTSNASQAAPVASVPVTRKSKSSKIPVVLFIGFLLFIVAGLVINNARYQHTSRAVEAGSPASAPIAVPLPPPFLAHHERKLLSGSMA